MLTFITVWFWYYPIRKKNTPWVMFKCFLGSNINSLGGQFWVLLGVKLKNNHTQNFLIRKVTNFVWIEGNRTLIILQKYPQEALKPHPLGLFPEMKISESDLEKIKYFFIKTKYTVIFSSFLTQHFNLNPGIPLKSRKVPLMQLTFKFLSCWHCMSFQKPYKASEKTYDASVITIWA